LPKPSPLGIQIEIAVDASQDHTIDPAGHSEYLLRYRTATGIPFAIGRTSKSSVRVWISADDRFKNALEAAGFVCWRSLPKQPTRGSRATGRNSNLEQITEFNGLPVYWTNVSSPSEALIVASKLRIS
jgi:hypothetical protein